MKNKNKKNQLLFVKNTLTELTPDDLQKINGGEDEAIITWPKRPDRTSITGIGGDGNE